MERIDIQWVEPFLDRTMALWQAEADTPSGIFNPYLDREWRHTADGPRTLVSQCRLIFNFAKTFERTGDPAFADLAHRGIAALERYFRDPAGRGWIWAVNGDGAVADDVHNAYGHAFVMLALGTAATVFQDERYRDLTLVTWAFMKERFQDEHGGLIWNIAPDGTIRDPHRSQNPMMHTFESLLVLAPLDPGGAVRDDLQHIAGFLQARLLAPGALPEWYEPDWQPVASGEHAVIDVGHAFEWAWLYSEAAALFGDDAWLNPARDCLAYAMTHGYDADGGIISPVKYDGQPPAPRKFWWEQCEAIRAISRHVTRHGATDLAGPLTLTLNFVQAHFVDHEFGGWYLNPPGMGGEPSFDKGNPFKLDYHVLNMCHELMANHRP